MPNTSSSILYLADVQAIQPQLDLLPLIPKALAQKTQTLVFGKQEKALTILTTNAFPTLYYQMIDKLKAMDYEVVSYFTDTDGFAHAMTWFEQLENKQEQEQQAFDHRHAARGEEAVALIKETYKNKQLYTEGLFISEILRLAFQSGASDVHFQTEEVGVVMRVRRDGLLYTVIVFTAAEFQKYLMKLKFMAGVKMNITDLSQDGRFDFDIPGAEETRKVDVRVSIMPGLRGESIVLRFLDASK
ncbi:MAG: Flp pilus assembly complex ATPase component TadA [Candidatus Peribacteria bacterium]|nr:MAG: Flp pilus assembly complex ATPase component TadA [Candidatus Peribacteria bacterium]